MEAVAAEPKPWHGRSSCQAEGAEPAWMLSKAPDHAVGTARPAGEAPWCCQFSVQPGVVFEALSQRFNSAWIRVIISCFRCWYSGSGKRHQSPVGVNTLAIKVACPRGARPSPSRLMETNRGSLGMRSPAGDGLGRNLAVHHADTAP